MEVVAVIDFETTGLSPAQGDRATEVAVVIVDGGRVVDRYQSLMNAGVRIPAYIEALTGISNAMVRGAPPAAEVMQQVSDFVGDIPIVAHNAAFDAKFWDAELARIHRHRAQDFVCSLLLSRRLFPLAPSHKLGALIE
ncbi:MAG: 3'-5' exonuclease, partial [Thauera sp.]|nr:3'-5' exonuclease [Thauera sp.]